MIDTHCHIDFEDYNNDRTDVIKRAKEKLDAVINSGTNLEGNQTVLNLSKENEGFIYPTFGFHPVTSQECTAEELHEAQKPLLMHVRDCEKKALNLINEYENLPYAVFHCFSGSLKTAKRIMEHDNYYMSFSTMLCYSQRHQELIKDIPLDHVLTETDSPYLAMTKEERNEPANVVKACEKIAEIKEMDLNTVDEITTNNAKRVFNI